MALPFTHDGYRFLLSELQKAGYTAADFAQGERLLNRNRPFVLLRHDIDFDLAPALELARIEAEARLFATYFVLLRTQHYNLFALENSRIVEEILALGHRLGLHFDAALYPECEPEALAACSNREADLLERWFGVAVDVVSFHRPGPAFVGGGPALTAPRLHTYLPLFTQQIHYLADSRGLWRYGEPLDSPAFLARQPLHLLTHPIWWRPVERAPLDTLHDFLDRRGEQLAASVAANSTVYRKPQP